ncbi:LysR family transcriptional regulator [Novosphingobium sp. KN65.2]|uniref:LysR family transcriptional regulator n=1 Tax=Novosphingobium sp. KN65.2 TaxID=1478134 RepID=UPI0005E73CF6|nr:LysR family transcriptional regulator [Novosphingobium sp. KN65.2]CDO38557.1 putative Transcriptional regulator, LysR family [Novosphingobium sp. KN65.2]
MNLRSVDLNLLPILQALLREGSVTAAAASLGLSQSATSHALTRLRHVLRDPLLVKVGRGMKLTPRAERLRESVNASCDAIIQALSQESFHPAEIVRSFKIATPDYSALIVGKTLLPQLRMAAPGVSVRFSDVGLSTRQQILDGSLDMALIARIPSICEGLSIHGGFFEQKICVAGLDHPIAANGRVTLAELARHGRLNIDFASYLLLDSGEDQAAEQIRVAPSHLLVLPFMAVETGSVAVVGRALGLLAARYAPIRVIELDDCAEPTEICLAWSPANDADPAHRWLREQLIDIMAQNFELTSKQVTASSLRENRT